MNWKGILIFISLIILGVYLIGFGSSAPPSQTNINVNVGYQIEVTHADFQEQGESHEYNAHVFNISDGLPLTDDLIVCDFHLYDHDGEHIIDEVDMTFNVDDGHWDYNVTGGNFTTLGHYSTLISCNSTSYGGFIFSEFEVTGTGSHLDTPQSIAFIGFLFILVFLFLATVGGITLLPSRNERAENGELISISNLKYLRSVLFGVAYLILMSISFLIANISLGYFEEQIFGKFFFAIFQIQLIMLLPMFVIWFLFILVSIFRDVELKKMLGRGVYS